MPYHIYIVGPAGSGKTSLAAALAEWMALNQLDASIVNMDPAAESLPYVPDVDIRAHVDARDLMRRFGLGPNGALIASMDMSVNHLEAVRSSMDERRANYYIVDTPGQLEIFAFRPAGPLIVERLSESVGAVVLFLVDTYMASRALSFASMLFLFLSTWLRLKKPQLLVLSKTDLYPQEVVEKILSWTEDPYELLESGRKEGAMGYEETILDLATAALENLEAVPVSSFTMKGFEELYAAIQRILAGGEDYYTEEPSPRL